MQKVALFHGLIIQPRIEKREDQGGDGNTSSATRLPEQISKFPEVEEEDEEGTTHNTQLAR
jgi:hypothetical protein